MPSKTRSGRKRRKYAKLPSSDPCWFSFAQFSPAHPPPWWEMLGHTAAEYYATKGAAKGRNMMACARDVSALFDHFDISMGAPGAFMDLALTLAFKHERDLVLQGKRVCYGALCERYGIDPDLEESAINLAMSLASKYEWSEGDLTRAKSDNWGTRLSDEDLERLWEAVISVKGHFERRGRDTKIVRAIAAVLQDTKDLAKIVQKEPAEAVHDILLRHSNVGRDGAPMSPDRWLRGVIPDLVSFYTALKSNDLSSLGKLSSLQKQLFFAVFLPALMEQHEQHKNGQNRPDICGRKEGDDLPT